MKTLHFALAIGAMICCTSYTTSAQQPTGPATLENLLKEETKTSPAASKTDTPNGSPTRLSGSVVRPKDGVKHPTLEKAWSLYETEVGRAAQSIRHAISKQFGAATAKGDLDAAERWQAALEMFEKKGEVSSLAELKSAVGEANADCKRAAARLADAYAELVKTLTMEKKIAEAKTVRDEWRTCSGVASAANADKPQAAVVPTPKQAVVVGRWRRVGDGDIADCDFRADGKGTVGPHRVVWKEISPNTFRFTFPDHPTWFMKVTADNGVVTGVLDNGLSVRFIKVQ